MSALVLVVEDNPATRKLVRVTLEGADYRVAAQSDGESALAFVEREVPQIVLCDLVLPDRSGLEVAEIIRERLGPRLPILAVSGFLPQVDETRLLANSVFDDYLIKPVSPRSLLETVNRHLASPRPVVPQGRRLLVVDDDSVQRRILSLRLRLLGYTVETASSGPEALDKVRLNPPDLVVSDVLMPGLDGFELCRQLRSDPKNPHLRVLLCSYSYVEEEDRQLALRLGASAYVTKAGGCVEVEAAIAKSLEQVPTRPAMEAGLEQEHFSRVVRQLERQVDFQRGLSRRLALKTAELAILGEMSEALVRHRDLENALDEILASCLDAGGISMGALYLPKDDGGLNVRTYGQGWQEGGRSLWARHPEIFESILARGLPVLLPGSLPHDEAFLQEAGLVSLLAIPLIFGEGPRGALVMASRSEVFEGDWSAFGRSLGLQIEQSLRLTHAFGEVEKARNTERRQSHLLESVLESMSEGVIVVDHEGHPTLHNPVGRSFLEYVELLSSDCDEQELSLPDGRFLSVTSRSLPDHGRRLTVWRDLTARRQAEAQEASSSRLASMGMLAAGVAHEISNPLTAMNYYLEMLPEGPLVEGAQEAARQVARLVGDLRLLSQPQDDLGLINLADVLQSTMRLGAAEVHAHARMLSDLQAVPPVRANASRLVQVFLNLLINAAHALAEGDGEIQVSLREASDGRVEAAITDNGPGIPAELLELVFQPFFTTKPAHRGSGLGLSIAHRIVTGFGGELRLESEVGRGTTALVFLPPA